MPCTQSATIRVRGIICELLFYIAIELTRKGIIEKDVTSGLFSTRLNELSELMEIAPDCVYGNVFISELKEMSLEIA